MRSNKGITLTSLIIYIIVFCIVIGTVSMISGYFADNIDEVVILSDTAEQYSRLTTYLSNDINSVDFESITVEESYITINLLGEIQHIYIYNNNKIYYIVREKEFISKNIVLCEKIDSYDFVYESGILTTSITINEIIYNNSYSIK